MESRINAAAAARDGILTRAELMALGLSPAAIGRRLACGSLRPLQRGVYLIGPLTPGTARVRAAVMAGGTGAVLSHTTAGGEWVMCLADEAGPVHVSVPGRRQPRRPGVRFHRVSRLDHDEHTTHKGLPITTPGRTLADLAGMLGSREVELAAAVALREGLLTGAELAALPARYSRRRGSAILRAVCSETTDSALTRSEAERRCLDLLRAAGLPRPHGNVPVGPYELDLLWPDEGLAIEIDGHAHHSSRPRFEGDRRKDMWLHARGIEVIRLTWRQITRDAIATAVQVGQALALARPRRDSLRTAGPPAAHDAARDA